MVRYERWFTDPAVLSELGTFLGTDVSRPLAQIRPRDAAAADPDDERQARFVREHCRTAAALGYRLER